MFFRRSLPSILSTLNSLVAQLEAHAEKAHAKADAAMTKAAVAAVRNKDIEAAAIQAATDAYRNSLDAARETRYMADQDASILEIRSDIHRSEATKALRVASKVKDLVA